MTDLTEAMARTTVALRAKQLPERGLELIGSAILDYLACAVAGSRTDASRLVVDWLRENGGHPAATVIGTDLRTAPAQAALANAVAGHALDFDDVSVRMIHPSVTIVPVLLAVGEARGASGTDVLDAYLAGFEIETRMCAALNPAHYEDGWHTTGTMGVFGATAAACRLYGLDLERTRIAFGIAGSAAGGVRRNAGSMVKPLHAGQSAFHGIQSAALAARGFTATNSVLEGPSGILDVYNKVGALADLRAAFAPDAPLELVQGGIAFKRFACCGAIHTALDALLDLVAADSIDAKDVERITVRVNSLTPSVLTHHVTQNPMQGKFSLEYSLAVAMIDGRAGLEQYTEARAADPALAAMMERVDVVVDPEIPVAQAFFASDVTIERRGGFASRRRVDVARGYPANPLSREDLVEKARQCCRGVLGEDGHAKLVHAVDGLADCPDLRQVASLLTAAPSDGDI
jgi:2-methylcitrate dehydratase PrpD